MQTLARLPEKVKRLRAEMGDAIADKWFASVVLISGSKCESAFERRRYDSSRSEGSLLAVESSCGCSLESQIHASSALGGSPLVESLIAILIAAGAIYLLAILLTNGVEWLMEQLAKRELEEVLRAAAAAAKR